MFTTAGLCECGPLSAAQGPPLHVVPGSSQQQRLALICVSWNWDHFDPARMIATDVPEQLGSIRGIRQG